MSENYLQQFVCRFNFKVIGKFLLAPRHVINKPHQAQRLRSWAIPLKAFDRSTSVPVSFRPILM